MVYSFGGSLPRLGVAAPRPGVVPPVPMPVPLSETAERAAGLRDSQRRDPAHNSADWIRRHAAASGDRLAVADDARRLSYRDLEARIARLAGWLEAAGIARGDRVGVLAGNCTPNLETVFAAARIGAIVLPINTRLSPPEICFLLDDSRAKGLVHEAHLRELADAACDLAQAPPPVRLEVGPDYEAALRALAD